MQNETSAVLVSGNSGSGLLRQDQASQPHPAWALAMEAIVNATACSDQAAHDFLHFPLRPAARREVVNALVGRLELPAAIDSAVARWMRSGSIADEDELGSRGPALSHRFVRMREACSKQRPTEHRGSPRPARAANLAGAGPWPRGRARMVQCSPDATEAFMPLTDTQLSSSPPRSHARMV